MGPLSFPWGSYAPRSAPTRRAHPQGQLQGAREAPRQTPAGSGQGAPVPQWGGFLGTPRTVLDCVVATLGLILDRSAERSVLDAQFSSQTPTKTQICCLLYCALRVLYTDGNVHPRLLPQFRDFRINSKGGRGDPVLLWSAPSRRAFPTLPVVVQPHHPLGLFILTLARSQASERRPLRRVRRCRRLRGCPHLHRVHLDANLGARVRHLVDYFGNLTQPHRVHLA